MDIRPNSYQDYSLTNISLCYPTECSLAPLQPEKYNIPNQCSVLKDALQNGTKIAKQNYSAYSHTNADMIPYQQQIPTPNSQIVSHNFQIFPEEYYSNLTKECEELLHILESSTNQPQEYNEYSQNYTHTEEHTVQLHNNNLFKIEPSTVSTTQYEQNKPKEEAILQQELQMGNYISNNNNNNIKKNKNIKTSNRHHKNKHHNNRQVPYSNIGDYAWLHKSTNS